MVVRIAALLWITATAGPDGGLTGCAHYDRSRSLAGVGSGSVPSPGDASSPSGRLGAGDQPAYHSGEGLER